jgi:hypothetical protein
MAGGNKGQAMQAKLRGDILSFPVKIATAIYRGTMVGIDGTGYLVQMSDLGAITFAGIAEEGCTAAEAVADGTVSVRVRRRGIFRMTKNTTSAVTDVGCIAYAHTGHSASVNELVGLAAVCTYDNAIGLIVRREPDTPNGSAYTLNYLMVEIVPAVYGLTLTRTATKRVPLTKTATATLTDAECLSYPIINAVHGSAAIALTLPAAASTNAGADVLIGMGGAAAVTVVCALGFGAGGSGKDTVTLAQGDMCHCISDGTNWYVNNVTTAA